MSELETVVRPILTPMVLGTRASLVLSPADQIKLAKWAYKTALMAEYTYPNPSLPDFWYQQFYEHRRMLPNRVIISTARYDTDHGLVGCYRNFAHINLSPVGVVGRIGPQDHRNVEAHVVTLLIGRAVFRVTFHEHVLAFAPLIGRESPERQLQPLWPPTSTPMAWPMNGEAIPGDEKTFKRLSGESKLRP